MGAGMNVSDMILSFPAQEVMGFPLSDSSPRTSAFKLAVQIPANDDHEIIADTFIEHVKKVVGV